MTWNIANSHAYRLWLKWVSDRPHYSGLNGSTISYDLDRIRASMLQEARWHRTGKSNATPGLIREVKGELILLGKVRKALTIP